MSRRILILFEYPTLSGGEHSMLAVLDELSGTADLEFFTAGPEAGPLMTELDRRGLRRFVLEPGAAWSQVLLRITRAHHINVVHANSLSMGRQLGRVASELAVPCTAHLRDIIRLSRTAMNDLNACTSLVAVSEATRTHHVSQGLDPARVVTIYNGVRLERYHPRPRTGWLHRQLNIPEQAQLALNVGQICLRKGHDILAQSALLLKDRFPNLNWVICGERYSTKAESREFESRFHHTFSEHGLENRLHCLGFCENIAEIMNETSLLVHTARQEPLGRVLLEAAASGLPIVATRVGGTEEVLSGGKTAWLVAADSPHETSQAVAEALEHPPLAQERANLARQVMEQRFALPQAAFRLSQFWKDICRADRADVES